MSHAHIARFPKQPTKGSDHNQPAVEQARKRIAEIPDLYQQHAAPNKEQLVGVVQPTSVAAEQQPSPGLFRKRVATEPEIPDMPELAMSVDLPAEHFEEPDAKTETPAWRRWAERLRPILIGTAALGLIFFIYKAPIFLSQISYLTADKPAVAPTPSTPQVGPEPVISIPKINVTAPIIFATSNVEEKIQKDLEAGVAHYANTANPGEPGNAVIFGHSSNDWWQPGNYKFVFVLLDRLVVGDTFTVNYNSKQYVYEVTGTKVVEPTDLSVLNSDGSHQMTLITCSPPGTSWRRLVVTSKQISPAPAVTATPIAQDSSDFDGQQLTGNSTNITEQFSSWWRRITGGSQ